MASEMIHDFTTDADYGRLLCLTYVTQHILGLDKGQKKVIHWTLVTKWNILRSRLKSWDLSG